MSIDGAVPSVDPSLLDFAVRLAAEAGRVSRERFLGGGWGVRLKGDGSEVTDVDVEVEELIRGELGRRTPEDGVFGEELGVDPGASGRRWVIDPVNGTANFVHRVPLFSNDLAYEDEFGPAVGVVGMPMSGEILAAGRGLGCWVVRGPSYELGDARRVRVSARGELRGARVQAHNFGAWDGELLAALHRLVLLVPSTGCMAAVATGRADAAVIAGPAMGYEDVATMPVIVTEAGGRVSDLRGADVLAGDRSVLVSNGALHDALLEVVGEGAHSRDLRELLGGGGEPGSPSRVR
ncbi:inositol monophosphatase family protein [Streptomyces acidiscabies]|uniref:inositol monophosphatase family protein n=1 Tax=Streptomyces acidiscabies TaxID=42234 RepID=UPI000950E41E|nr:inositol monophosphatase family protein [Streptomyces acidiscabies]